jgi:hypothetical protein
MSSRVITLLGVLAIAIAVWYAARGGASPAAATPSSTTQWVATAPQRGIVGYRDPAVGVSPSGRLVAYSEGRALRVVPIGGGVEVARALADGQIRHLAWIDDLRVLFEVGDAAEHWRLLEIGVGARALWPTAELSGSGASAGVSVKANSLRQLVASADGAWLAGVVTGREGSELWRIRLDGQELVKVAVDGRPSWPAWTPAGEVGCVLATAAGPRRSTPLRRRDARHHTAARYFRAHRLRRRRDVDLRRGPERARLRRPVARRSHQRPGAARQ